MNITKVLIDEHQLILKVLGLLGKARLCLENGERIPPGFFETAMNFCSGFADQFHHFKEEFLLFGFLSYKKQGGLDSAMGTLRYQHSRCRECIAGILQALPGYEENDGIALSFLLENLAVYGSLLQRHIYEEDVVFFPLAENILTPEEKESLVHQFEEEEERIGGRRVVFEKYQDIAYHLAQLLP